MMVNYEYKVQLGLHRARNEKEVQALQRALDTMAAGSQVRSLVIVVDSPKSLAAQQKLLESSCLSHLENLALKLDVSLGATSLGVLAKVIEGRHLPWLLHLSISYQSVESERQHPGSSSSSQHSKSSTWYDLLRSSSGGRLGAHSSSSSSSTSRNQTSSFQDENFWEGFALLAGVLRENLLPRLEKSISLSSNWSSRNLGDVGVKYLAELISTGYLSGLKELNLEDNLIGSDGMEALAWAFRGGNMAALEVLNLNKNVFHPSATGIMEVVKVMEDSHLPNLKWIGLSGAGHQEIPNGGSVANEIVAAFTRNTSLTTDVQIDWPDRRVQGRWKAILKRNLKLTRILHKLGGQEDVPIKNRNLGISNFCASLRRSRFGTFIRKGTYANRNLPGKLR